jgi:hypothetical protein
MKSVYISILAFVCSLSSLAQAPANDDPCNAVTLTLSPNDNCSNALSGTTLNATTSTGLGYANPVECGVNAQPKDVWYKVTTPASGTGSTRLHFKLSAAGGAPMASGNITLFKGNGSWPSLTMSLVSGACINSGAEGFTTITFAAQFLTPNTTYYLRVNTVRDTDADGTFSVCAYLPLSTPPCVAYISPSSNATNVPVNQNVTFQWNAAPGTWDGVSPAQLLYDVHLSANNPPVPTVSSNTATSYTTKFLAYNKKYYWYVAPRNSTGAATGCPVDSFTTAPPPANCIPLTTNGCRTNDTLKLVKLNGENGTSINNATGCSPNGYADYTGTTNIEVAQGKAYSGLLHARSVWDFFTVWIDYNDDGYYTNNERVLNNLRQQWSAEPTPFTINIPANAPVGTHKMRVRSVYYAVNPAVASAVTDPCNNYDYGETEDYSISIIPAATAPAPIVAAGAINSCMQTGSATIDNPSNNATELVQVVDLNNAVVAAIDANGNDLGQVQVNVYKNSGTIRTLANGTKVLDRNIAITPRFQPTSPVKVRLYFTSQELAALQGADPAVTGINSLTVTKVNDTCSAGGSTITTGPVVAQTANGTLTGGYYMDVTVSGFSTFYIHGGVNAPLPVSISSFRAERNGDKIKVEWITATESNNKGFELQRSADGRNFSSLAFVVTKAPQGNSAAQLRYDHIDEKPTNGNNYYRLKQTDKDGNVSYSAIALVRGNGVTFIETYPNPAKDRLKIKLSSTTITKVDVVITDLAGRVIKQQPAQVIAGDNAIDMNLGTLQAGQYTLKVICNNGCESVLTRIVKQ